MIPAAGLGKRMRPLTANIPKPLLPVAGKPLIVHRIEALVAAGVTELVINHAYLGEQIEAALGDGSRWGARIVYSAEEEPLETAGGIQRALPLLGEPPFIICNADVWTDFELSSLLDKPVDLAHLIFVPNPDFHSQGDFVLQDDGQVRASGEGIAVTYAGISVLSPRLFDDFQPGYLPLLPVLLAAMAEGRVSGELFEGDWFDVGTPERLQQLEQRLR